MSFLPKFMIEPVRPYLYATLAYFRRSERLLRGTSTVLHAMYRESLLSTERNRDPKRLLTHGFHAYSQTDEDGMIQEIFRRIGVSSRIFVELGVGDGNENNTLYLMLSGWRGLWIEAGESNAASIGQRFASFIQSKQLTFLQNFVTRETINQVIGDSGFSGEIDLLSIDIDGND
jgi:hypothetical protein